MRNQKGFTLIEIIAVLVILGILAAVAVPRYIDLQTDARRMAVQGALAALQSTATMNYAQGLLNGTATATTWTEPADFATNISVGDYNGTITHVAGLVTVTVTGPSATGVSGIISGLSGTELNKTFNMW